jgi:cytochrome b561
MTTISPADAMNGMARRGATEYDAPAKFMHWLAVPPICAKGSEIGHLVGSFHKTFGLLFLVLIAIHVAGVLYHHLVQGDRILARMLPRDAKTARRPARALV